MPTNLGYPDIQFNGATWRWNGQMYVNQQTGETASAEQLRDIQGQEATLQPAPAAKPTGSPSPIAAEDAQDDTDGLGGGLGGRLDPQALAQQRQSDRRLDMGTRLLETLATAGANIFGARDARKADRRTAQSGARANLINALAGNIVAQPTQRQATPGVGTSLLSALGQGARSVREAGAAARARRTGDEELLQSQDRLGLERERLNASKAPNKGMESLGDAFATVGQRLAQEGRLSADEVNTLMGNPATVGKVLNKNPALAAEWARASFRQKAVLKARAVKAMLDYKRPTPEAPESGGFESLAYEAGFGGQSWEAFSATLPPNLTANQLAAAQAEHNKGARQAQGEPLTDEEVLKFVNDELAPTALTLGEQSGGKTSAIGHPEVQKLLQSKHVADNVLAKTSIVAAFGKGQLKALERQLKGKRLAAWQQKAVQEAREGILLINNLQERWMDLTARGFLGGLIPGTRLHPKAKAYDRTLPTNMLTIAARVNEGRPSDKDAQAILPALADRSLSEATAIELFDFLRSLAQNKIDAVMQGVDVPIFAFVKGTEIDETALREYAQGGRLGPDQIAWVQSALADIPVDTKDAELISYRQDLERILQRHGLFAPTVDDAETETVDDTILDAVGAELGR